MDRPVAARAGASVESGMESKWAPTVTKSPLCAK
jgi:hypothetical protein